jgi:hypothetical protein
MYIELVRLNRGEFVKREPLFFTNKALEIYQKTIDKFNGSNQEVLVTLRHDTHVLVQSWTNAKIKEVPKGNRKRTF